MKPLHVFKYKGMFIKVALLMLSTVIINVLYDVPESEQWLLSSSADSVWYFQCLSSSACIQIVSGQINIISCWKHFLTKIFPQRYYANSLCDDINKLHQSYFLTTYYIISTSYLTLSPSLQATSCCENSVLACWITGMGSAVWQWSLASLHTSSMESCLLGSLISRFWVVAETRRQARA